MLPIRLQMVVVGVSSSCGLGGLNVSGKIACRSSASWFGFPLSKHCKPIIKHITYGFDISLDRSFTVTNISLFKWLHVPFLLSTFLFFIFIFKFSLHYYIFSLVSLLVKSKDHSIHIPTIACFDRQIYWLFYLTCFLFI